MKRTFSLFFALLLCAICNAQQNPAVGKWDCTSDDGHGAVRQWTLTLNQSLGKLSGTIVTEETNMPLLEPKLEGNFLSFKTFVNPNCTILFEVTLDKDKLSGKFSCPEVSGTLVGKKSS